MSLGCFCVVQACSRIFMNDRFRKCSHPISCGIKCFKPGLDDKHVPQCMDILLPNKTCWSVSMFLMHFETEKGLQRGLGRVNMCFCLFFVALEGLKSNVKKSFSIFAMKYDET